MFTKTSTFLIIEIYVPWLICIHEMTLYMTLLRWEIFIILVFLSTSVMLLSDVLGVGYPKIEFWALRNS